MAWQLHLVDNPSGGEDGKVPIGTMYRTKRGNEEGYGVFLPGGIIWWTYQHATDGQRWQVTIPTEGPEHMTVYPSLNYEGVWHGWIRDGVISDDVGGKHFD